MQYPDGSTPADVDPASLQRAREAKARLAAKDKPGPHQHEPLVQPDLAHDTEPSDEDKQRARWRQITAGIREQAEHYLAART